MRLIHCNNVAVRYFSRLSDRGPVFCLEARISHVEFRFPGSENKARAGMVEWNGIFRLFRFSGILGQPREVLPKFRNEIMNNVCSIRSPTRNFRNFWSNGKCPVCFVFPCQTTCCPHGNLPFVFLISYAYICTCIR